MRIALTQSEGRLAGLEAALLAGGHDVVRNPLVATAPLLTDEARRAARGLLECPWLLFPSPAAVAAWEELGLPLRGPHLGAVGGSTAGALARQGAEVVLTGEPQTAAGLAAAFLRHPAAAGPVGLPRGDRALSTLPEALARAGFRVRPAVIYQSQTLPWQAGEVDAVVLASPSAVAALPQAVGKRARLVVLGPTTAGAVSDAGWNCVQAPTPDADAVTAAIEGLG